MKILLIGNFAPPYEEESLHNLTLLHNFQREGNRCVAINLSENPSIEKGIMDIKGYFDFVIKLMRFGLKSDVVHFLTKAYTRPGLMKLVTAIVFGRLTFKKAIITLHSELFSVFGQLRSKMGGQQLLNLSFSSSNRVICGDRHTYEVAATHYKSKEKFAIVPAVIQIPDDLKENETNVLKKLQGKKKVIFFSNLRYPSLLFEMLNILLSKYLTPETEIVVSFSEKFSSKFRHAVEDVGKHLMDNLLFIDPADTRMLSISYARADLVLRNLSCDGKPLFDDIALCARRSSRSGKYVCFPLSLSLVKEGDVEDLCAYLFNNILMERTAGLPPATEDFYEKIKEIYLND
ncbi:MAG: glycosyltransferase family 1 protein [Nitrospiraceae bacterium]|nr:MAG: glycosyltransferase family 1 protein [Nitrospiraceae bacterium]